MDYNVVMLDRAKKDLQEILDYKAQFYPGTADKFIDEFEEKQKNIAANPYMYQEYSRDTRYRRVIMLDYLLFYRITDRSNTVRIYRIINGKTDLAKYI